MEYDFDGKTFYRAPQNQKQSLGEKVYQVVTGGEPVSRNKVNTSITKPDGSQLYFETPEDYAHFQTQANKDAELQARGDAKAKEMQQKMAQPKPLSSLVMDELKQPIGPQTVQKRIP